MVRLTPNGLSVSAAAARDFFGQILRRRLRQRGDEAERAGVGDGRDQFGAADPLHAALHDRVLDADEFGESRFDHSGPLFPRRGCRARSFSRFQPGRMPLAPGKCLPGAEHVRAAQSCKSGALFPQGGIVLRTAASANGRLYSHETRWCSSPMPSIATVTVLTGSFMTPTPTDVPQAIRSPGRASCRARSC